ncbi:MAG: hypothetical protein O6931_08685 [Gammaproteobacteria bacterium]|nr:hypothetical protein [Gammaproteobacteria bacterium]
MRLAAAVRQRYFDRMRPRNRQEDWQESRSFDPQRRRFLGGLAGAAWLAGTGGVVSGCSSSNVLRVPLAAVEADLLRVLAPSVLHGLLPIQPNERTDSLNELLSAVSTSVSSLSGDSREQLARLLAALDYRVTRWLLTGLWKPLAEASIEEIDEFLNNWRNSSIGRFNLAYRTLTRLLVNNWFVLPAHFAQAGYPGPPSWAVELNVLRDV